MILALKTSDDTAGLWLYASPSDQKLVAELSWHSGRALADQLLIKIDDFVREYAGGMTELTGIIVFSGPGSFTSLRIGHTVANAMADSLNICVVGAGSEHWQRLGLEALSTARLGQPAFPVYGSEPNVTRPKT
jgi:tRNA threonylcarbamoyladenosine biosynthesis protein TsaB